MVILNCYFELTIAIFDRALNIVNFVKIRSFWNINWKLAKISDWWKFFASWSKLIIIKNHIERQNSVLSLRIIQAKFTGYDYYANFNNHDTRINIPHLMKMSFLWLLQSSLSSLICSHWLIAVASFGQCNCVRAAR